MDFVKCNVWMKGIDVSNSLETYCNIAAERQMHCPRGGRVLPSPRATAAVNSSFVAILRCRKRVTNLKEVDAIGA